MLIGKACLQSRVKQVGLHVKAYVRRFTVRETT